MFLGNSHELNMFTNTRQLHFFDQLNHLSFYHRIRYLYWNNTEYIHQLECD